MICWLAPPGNARPHSLACSLTPCLFDIQLRSPSLSYSLSPSLLHSLSYSLSLSLTLSLSLSLSPPLPRLLHVPFLLRIGAPNSRPHAPPLTSLDSSHRQDGRDYAQSPREHGFTPPDHCAWTWAPQRHHHQAHSDEGPHCDCMGCVPGDGQERPARQAHSR